MKKLFAMALALALVFACGKPNAVPNPPLVLGEKYSRKFRWNPDELFETVRSGSRMEVILFFMES